MSMEVIEVCLRRVEIALLRGNREEAVAAINSFCDEPQTVIGLDSHIAELTLPLQVINELERVRVHTVGDLATCSRRWIQRRTKNIDFVYIDAIDNELSRHGLALAPDQS